MADPADPILTLAQRQQLYEALLAAFPVPGDLIRLAGLRLGLNLEEISGPRGLRDRVYQLVQWAEAHGQVRALLTAALKENPTNPQLQAADSALLGSGAPGASLQPTPESENPPTGDGTLAAPLPDVIPTGGGSQWHIATASAGRDLYIGSHVEQHYHANQQALPTPPVDSPAIRDGLLQAVTPSTESVTADYYEGKSARLGHILAGFDAPRPQWQKAISDVLAQVQVGIIQASSGQGKSTLLYRYIADHFIPGAVFRIRACSREEHVGQIVTYLRQQLGERQPLLVFIDNLNQATSLWYQVVTELSGQPISFLLTTRVEDWYRFRQGLSGFSYKFIKPELSVTEARAIFHYFQARNRLDTHVPSAEWAYEQLADKHLLIEFVYLITHGQMLAERIEEQVRRIEQRGEDPAKLTILRLVATAQVYGAPISTAILRRAVTFQRDPQEVLNALKGEYIDNANGSWEALHFVRAEHLVQVLHGDILPVEETLLRLIEILDLPDLPAFALEVFKQHSDAALLVALITRYKSEDIAALNAIIESLFLVGEFGYLQAHKPLVDHYVQEFGPTTLPLLGSTTRPMGDRNTPNFSQYPQLQATVTQFKTRQALHSHDIGRKFLAGVAASVSITTTTSPTDIGVLSEWCQFYDITIPAIDHFFLNGDWKQSIGTGDVETLSTILYALYKASQHTYQQFLTDNKVALLNLAKLKLDLLTIREDDEDLVIEFLVDERENAESINDQGVSRLEHLHRWFPYYKIYKSTAISPNAAGVPHEWSTPRKQLANETLERMLQASINARYLRLLEAQYTPLLVFDWAQAWYQLRRKTLVLIRNLISNYEGFYKRKKLAQVSNLRMDQELRDLYQQIPTLPPRLKPHFEKQASQIQNWFSATRNFLHQLEHQSLADHQKNHLMRYNLRDSVIRLSGMHAAFAEIFAGEGDVFNATALNSVEETNYQYISEILEYWAANPVHDRRDLVDTIKKRRTVRQQTELASIKNALKFASDNGSTIYYPLYLVTDEKQLTNIYVGYEIENFTQRAEEFGAIITLLAPLTIDYNYIYVVPAKNGHRYNDAWRIEKSTIPRLVAGEQLTEGIYPVAIPSDFYTVVPGIQADLLPEVPLFHRFKQIQDQLIALRNRLYFAFSHLDAAVAEDKALLNEYDRNARQEIDKLTMLFDLLYREALRYTDTNSAQTEWDTLWSAIQDEIRRLLDLSTVNASYTLEPVRYSSALEPLLQSYLNRRYITG